MRYFLIFLILFTKMYAFNDSDLDGVEDSKDLCPNTPLDAIVDKNGCSKDKKDKQVDNENIENQSNINIEFYFDSSLNSFKDKTNTLNLYLAYNKNSYLFSTNISKYKIDNKDSYDISLTVQKDKTYKSLYFSYYIQTKFYIDNPYNKKSDYTLGGSLSYNLNSKSYVFSSLSYTINGSQSDIKNKNYFDLSFGYGYSINSKLSTSISINYESKTQESLKDELYLALNLNYNINKKYYTYFNYDYYIRANSYKHSYTIGIGANF